MIDISKVSDFLVTRQNVFSSKMSSALFQLSCIDFLRIIWSVKFEVQVCTGIRTIMNVDCHYLNTTSFSRTLHPGSYINRITPNIIMRFSSTNHTSGYRSVVNTHFKNKMIKTLLVYFL